MKNLVLLSAACGVGKSTVRDELDSKAMLDGYACIDTDEVGINWWDYAGSENESKFSEDCLAAAVRMAGDKNLFFVGCLNPLDLFRSVSIPDSITSTYFIGMTCSDGEITRRLRARPAERMCGSDEFIASQIDYNNWFRRNAGKFQLYIDNTNQTAEETAREIADFVRKL